MANREAAGRTITAGERLGVWIGFSAWWILLCFVAMPHTGELALPILGAAVLSSLLAIAALRLARRARGRRFVGLVVGAIGALLLYWALALEPAIAAFPVILERMETTGSVTEVPWFLGAGLLAVGLALLWRGDVARAAR